ncbi:hypothetical protein C2S51_021896 [Perilla frutescens var. frutescens]|nr:hypothetical protein C2S51_021896 [Perilla frutescens var. frutescens]
MEIVKSNPSLLHIELVEQSFGPQSHSHVFRYGGGMKRKDFNDSRDLYIKELEAKLHEKDEEIKKFRGRFDTIESRLTRIEGDKSNPDTLQTPNIDTGLE